MIVGTVGFSRPEYEVDKAKPFKNGSGFATPVIPKKDRHGNTIKTLDKQLAKADCVELAATI